MWALLLFEVQDVDAGSNRALTLRSIAIIPAGTKMTVVGQRQSSSFAVCWHMCGIDSWCCKLDRFLVLIWLEHAFTPSTLYPARTWSWDGCNVLTLPCQYKSNHPVCWMGKDANRFHMFSSVSLHKTSLRTACQTQLLSSSFLSHTQQDLHDFSLQSRDGFTVPVDFI